MLALGPFAITTLLALVLGRLPVAMWGYPLWSFAPLAALLWLGPVTDAVRLRRFAAGFLAVFAAMPLAYVIVEGLEPLVRDRPKATQFPGRQLAAAVTQRWRDKFSTPLPYVGGGEFATNNIAVYSPDRPHVIVHADRRASARGSIATTCRRRGAVLVWEDGQIDADRARAAALGLSGAGGAGAADPAAPDLRGARQAASGARARRVRAAAAVRRRLTPCRPPRPRSRLSGRARRGRRSPDRSRTAWRRRACAREYRATASAPRATCRW